MTAGDRGTDLRAEADTDAALGADLVRRMAHIAMAQGVDLGGVRVSAYRATTPFFD